jgi:GNAT superfamily N-acetyltransferase
MSIAPTGSKPDPFAVRRASPSDAGAIARVRVDAWRATYRGMIPDAYLDAMKVEESEALWRRVLSAGPNRTCTFVAERAGDVVGFASALMLAEPRFDLDAELSAIYVRSDCQRIGVGRSLLGSVILAQCDLGATGFLTWVIARNRGARTFYEALGGELLVEQPFQWDGMDLVEAGYGWRDPDALMRACDPAPDRQY